MGPAAHAGPSQNSKITDSMFSILNAIVSSSATPAGPSLPAMGARLTPVAPAGTTDRPRGALRAAIESVTFWLEVSWHSLLLSWRDHTASICDWCSAFCVCKALTTPKVVAGGRQIPIWPHALSQLQLYQISLGGLKSALHHAHEAFPHLATLPDTGKAHADIAGQASALLAAAGSAQPQAIAPVQQPLQQQLSAPPVLRQQLSVPTAAAHAATVAAGSPAGSSDIQSLLEQLIAASGLGGPSTGTAPAAPVSAMPASAADHGVDPDTVIGGLAGAARSMDPSDCSGEAVRSKRPRTEQSSRVCSNCGTTNTPFWRKCRHTGLSLCNACGLYSAKKDHPRPVKLWREGQQVHPAGPAQSQPLQALPQSVQVAAVVPTAAVAGSPALLAQLQCATAPGPAAAPAPLHHQDQGQGQGQPSSPAAQQLLELWEQAHVQAQAQAASAAARATAPQTQAVPMLRPKPTVVAPPAGALATTACCAALPTGNAALAGSISGAFAPAGTKPAAMEGLALQALQALPSSPGAPQQIQQQRHVGLDTPGAAARVLL